jgi:hypothetical protein
VPLELMFKKVITGVKAETRGAQTPWSEASIQGNFYFHTQALPAMSAAAGVDPRQMELEFWESIKNSRSAAEFHAYLDRYPHGEFAPLAANRMKLLQSATSATLEQHTAAAAPAPTPAATAQAAAALRPATMSSEQSRRCQSILERVQLGDSLNDQDRVYVKENCSR